MNLYNEHAKHFSDTRKFPWAGWKKILPYIIDSKKLRVLDLGCGNARFLDFLIQNNVDLEMYVGLDSSAELLDIAKERVSSTDDESEESTLGNLNKVDVQFIKADLEKEWMSKLNCKFDLIVIFGVMHHISDFDTRKRILADSFSLLSNQGIHITTYWQFGNNKEFLEKHVVSGSSDPSTSSAQNKSEFSENDYQLSFGKNGATRFSHHFTDEEVNKIYKDLDKNITEEFSADGFGNKMNRYVVSVGE